MKTLKLIVHSLCFFLFATMVNGQEDANFFASIAKSETPKAIAVELRDLDGARTHIHIMNYQGVTVYSDYLWGEDRYAANYVMEGMPLGDYLIHISNRTGRKVRAIHLSDENLSLFTFTRPQASGKESDFTAAKREGQFLARFSTVEGEPALGVQLANLKYQPTTLFMARLEGIPIMDKKLDNPHAYARQLNLNGLPEGNYYYYVKNRETSLFQMFRIKGESVELGEKLYRDKTLVETGEILVTTY